MVSRMRGGHDSPELAYRWAGASRPGTPTLVLLHGLGDSGDCWPDAVRRWSPRYRVVGVDALGHGRSPRFTPSQLLSPDPMEEMYSATETAVEAVVASQGDRVILVGHSMGGGLAGALASRRPDLVRAAVLEEPAWRDPYLRVQPAEVVEERIADCRAFVEDLEAQLAQGRRENPGWAESELAAWAQAKTEVDLDFLALGVASLAAPWDQLLLATTVPLLALTGDTGVLLSADIRARAEAIGNPRLRLVVVPRAGHCVRRDQPEAFHAVVDPWLADQV